MSFLYPITSSGVLATFGAATVAVGGATALASNERYVAVSNLACWVSQGTSKIITCVAKASIVDGETVSITLPTTYLPGIGTTAPVVYEFDVAGNGVKAGNVQVNISTDTTAIQVAARLHTAITANQPSITITDPADGTLTLVIQSTTMTVTKTVANAGFTITTGVVTTTVGNGSVLLMPGVYLEMDGNMGPQLGVIQDAAGGRICLMQCRLY